MSWLIAADSACDLYHGDVGGPDVLFDTVPFIIQVEDRQYVDDESLDVEAMLADMEQTAAASRTACPSPESWAQLFTQADHVVAVTISGNLSGSLNSALAARHTVLEQHPDHQIAVIDSRATGPETAMCIRHIADWIRDGLSISGIETKAWEFLQRCKTSFALSSFDNLVKNGRMNKLIGFVARKLGMWGIGIGSDAGTITMHGKSRGAAKALSIMVEDMVQRGYMGGEAAISHSQNEPMALLLRQAIQARWPGASVPIMKARGLDSFYAERGGLILGFLGKA